MKEYKCIEIGSKAYQTEEMLNQYASEGWIVKCSYAYDNNWLILEREIKILKTK